MRKYLAACEEAYTSPSIMREVTGTMFAPCFQDQSLLGSLQQSISSMQRPVSCRLGRFPSNFLSICEQCDGLLKGVKSEFTGPIAVQPMEAEKLRIDRRYRSNFFGKLKRKRDGGKEVPAADSPTHQQKRQRPQVKSRKEKQPEVLFRHFDDF